MPIAKYSRYLLPIQCFLFLFLWACNFPFTSCICAGSSCEVFSWIWAEHKTEENPNEFSNSLFIYLCVCVCVCVCVSPGGALVVKNLPANAGDAGSIPGSRRSPGGGHGYPLQYTCLENPIDRGTWQTTVHGVTKSQTRLK